MSRAAFVQVLRYGGVGLLSNFLGYIVYIGIVAAGVGHKLAMSIVYAAVFAMSFYGNRRFTFDHRGAIGAVGVKFVAVYALGYWVNLSILFFFVDKMGYRHEVVQLIAIGVIAVQSFILLKFFVFKKK